MTKLPFYASKALLSDGILGWRVYVVWNQRPWLRYMLIMGLVSNFGRGIVQPAQVDWVNYAPVIGITSAALITMVYAWEMSKIFSGDIGDIMHVPSLDWDSINLIYKAWIWMAFALNSGMTASILWRIRYLDSLLNISVFEPFLTHLDLGVLGIFTNKDLAATQLC
jgi:hypothetical protein